MPKKTKREWATAVRSNLRLEGVDIALPPPKVRSIGVQERRMEIERLREAEAGYARVPRYASRRIGGSDIAGVVTR